MSRTTEITLLLGAAFGASILYALVQPEPLGFQPPKGIVSSPTDAREIAGHYRIGDGEMSTELELGSDMSYRTEAWSCGDCYRRSAGTWSMTHSRVVFNPQNGEGPHGMSVLLFKKHWVLLPDNATVQQAYQRWGVCRFSCFQNTNSIFWGP